jgi:deoxyribodipyrimidine photo-lyase
MVRAASIDLRRVRKLSGGEAGEGPVLYWMSRDQRAADNWALLHAQAMAMERGAPLAVVFCLASNFLGAGRRQYGFLLRGLEGTAAALEEKGIPFRLLTGDPGKEIPALARRVKAAAVVADFDPLRIKREWKEKAGRSLRAPLLEVDAHNIVPCWLASPKREWSAATFRPRFHRLLDDFLTPFPPLGKHPHPWPDRVLPRGPDWNRLLWAVPGDPTVPEVEEITPGEEAASRVLEGFLRRRLPAYDASRNDPSVPGQSGLSPYLHFGHLSPQRAALLARDRGPAAEAFLEQLTVRRELADNFCHYQAGYDSYAAFPEWARRSLDAHRKDARERVYPLHQLEEGRTHDPLWNAAQMEMVHTGKMHGYMRMYWAKRILEWSASPEEALAAAIALNDRWSLDGRDPNGYAGIAWSMGGVHDRSWGNRPVMGGIRPMTAAGCRRKFDVAAYIGPVRALDDALL